MDVLSLTVITPAGEVLREDGVALVLAPSVDGQVGILPNHAPLMAQLEPGTLEVRQNGGSRHLSVMDGFMEVMDNNVTILVDASENSELIDRARAQRAYDDAQAELEGLQEDYDEDINQIARKKMLRAQARLRTVERSQQT
jgi:F-type H+-transporting ATPase subunit epsilon